VQENDSKQYQINISGISFPLSSAYGEEHVRAVEKFLGNQIKEAPEQSEEFGPSSIALLVALNLADKLLTLQKKVTKFDGIEADLQTLYYRLDKVLAEKKTD